MPTRSIFEKPNRLNLFFDQARFQLGITPKYPRYITRTSIAASKVANELLASAGFIWGVMALASCLPDGLDTRVAMPAVCLAAGLNGMLQVHFAQGGNHQHDQVLVRETNANRSLVLSSALVAGLFAANFTLSNESRLRDLADINNYRRVVCLSTPEKTMPVSLHDGRKALVKTQPVADENYVLINVEAEGLYSPILGLKRSGLASDRIPLHKRSLNCDIP